LISIRLAIELGKATLGMRCAGLLELSYLRDGYAAVLLNLLMA